MELKIIDDKIPQCLSDLVASFETMKQKSQIPDPDYINQMVEISYKTQPDQLDPQKYLFLIRTKTYSPVNAYPVPGYYPQTPLSLFQSRPAIFERFELDTLFFAFYYRPGSYQQFLASRELKRQSWRFHKIYQTWFQRHEEPTEVNDMYEQGTYLYFDYEDTWTQKKKVDFKYEFLIRFEYKYLEDDMYR